MLHFQICTQTNNAYIVSSFLLSLCGTKYKVKKKIERNAKTHCLIGFLKGQFLDSKAKNRGTVLNL